MWMIEAVESVDGPDVTPEKEYVHSKEELARGVRYVRDGDVVRLLHVATNSYLMSHDVASPLTTTNMEITTFAKNPNDTRFADTLWRIETKEKNTPGGKLKSKRDMLRIINHKFKVAVLTSKKKLPKWGFEQQEINGSKNLKEDVGTIWFVDEVEHARISNGAV
jgi:dolichyl-phosphate-mannose-protein mannosyltransferase